MQPNQQQRQQMLSVDIQKVIEAEAAAYTRIIADLTRQNAVLSIALDDQQAENRELRAKLAALSGSTSTFAAPPVRPQPVIPAFDAPSGSAGSEPAAT